MYIERIHFITYLDAPNDGIFYNNSDNTVHALLAILQ